jgi:hypothetical protein
MLELEAAAKYVLMTPLKGVAGPSEPGPAQKSATAGARPAGKKKQRIPNSNLELTKPL